MATFTTNYNLRKPATSDFVEVTTDINASMDAIDTEMKQSEDAIADHETRIDSLEALLATSNGFKLEKTFLLHKTANESVASSTTLQDDDIFSFAVEANKLYVVTGVLHVSGSDAGDIRLNTTNPTAITGRFNIQALSTTATTRTDSLNTQTNTYDGATATTVGGDILAAVVAATYGLQLQAIFKANAATGTWTLQWAQRVSSATATVVEAFSYLKVEVYEAA